MDKTTSVYWLYDETCIDPRTDGYIGFTSQKPPKRFSQHQYATGIYRKVPKKFCSLILFQGTVEECELLEKILRPHKFIGWNVLAGGSHSLKRHGIHNFRFGTHMSEKEKQKIRIKIIERGGIINPVPPGTRRSEETKTAISAGVRAAGPLTTEQRVRQHNNTGRGKTHPNFGKSHALKTVQKMREAALAHDWNGERNGFFGKRHSEETKAYQSANKVRDICVNGHPKEPGKGCRICNLAAAAKWRVKQITRYGRVRKR